MATKRKNGLFSKSETYRVTRAPGRSNETTYKGFKVWKTWPEGFKTSADPDSLFDSLADVKRFIGTLGKNPVYRKREAISAKSLGQMKNPVQGYRERNLGQWKPWRGCYDRHGKGPGFAFLGLEGR